jgi:hypothetical protein
MRPQEEVFNWRRKCYITDAVLYRLIALAPEREAEFTARYDALWEAVDAYALLDALEAEAKAKRLAGVAERAHAQSEKLVAQKQVAASKVIWKEAVAPARMPQCKHCAMCIWRALFTRYRSNNGHRGTSHLCQSQAQKNGRRANLLSLR